MTTLKTNRAFSITTLLIVLAIGCASLAQAQVYTQLHNFDWHTEGANPNYPALLAQGEDGNIYGTLQTQFPHKGSIFVSTVTGTLSPLYIFTGTPDGSTPQSGLSLGFDGNFYGTTEEGGANNFGSIFKFSGGGPTLIHSLGNGTDGAYPWAPPIQAPDGNLYGITNNGNNPGEIYRISPSSGAFSTIGTAPSGTGAPLILGTDGNLYGTTPYGGNFNHGTVFQSTLKGKLKVVHSFNDGTTPSGPVLQGADGKLYGITTWGGTFGQGVVYQMNTSGAGYKVLHNLQVIEGSNSSSGLVQGSDKFLYGVTARGGANSLGTLFKVNTTGTTFAVLHDFDTASGSTPFGTPMLHTNGIIYGTTNDGGTPNAGYGVLYSFDAGLKPFASLVVIWSGKVGTSVGILGQGFSSATGVKFGSGAGTFSVVSDTFLIASPAQGSTTGNVTILEPSGNLVTPQVFKVIPSIKDFSPPNGPVGTAVTINGMSLTQTTAVTFGGVKATSFTVNSDTQVTAVVPTGAKTGTIGITTNGGKATSSQKFTVQ